MQSQLRFATFQIGEKMELNEMVLVIENWKGTEINVLMTVDEYLKFICVEDYDSKGELAILMVELGRTLGQEKEWMEFFFTANKSVCARYCANEKQLTQFLQGCLNSSDQTWRFDESRCSQICLKKLNVMGMNTKGWITGVGLSYTKLESSFEQGQILHNFNNNDYRVMEKLSERNLLLMDVRTGNFTVAQGVDLYARHPSGEELTDDNSMIGVEWGHGLYLSSTPSSIDFRYIRQEYGTPNKIESVTDYRDMLESKFKVYHKLTKDELANDSIKNAATNALYEEFGTGMPDAFMENLDSGRYDSGFIETLKKEKGWVM